MRRFPALSLANGAQHPLLTLLIFAGLMACAHAPAGGETEVARRVTPVRAEAGVEQILGGIGFVQNHVIAGRIRADLRAMRGMLQLPGAVDAGQFQHVLQVLRGCGLEFFFCRSAVGHPRA